MDHGLVFTAARFVFTVFRVRSISVQVSFFRSHVRDRPGRVWNPRHADFRLVSIRTSSATIGRWNPRFRRALWGRPVRKKVIFVHGCYWHQHAEPKCPIRVVPTSNTAYWGPELMRNSSRDAENRASLQQLGWKSLVIWECDLRERARVTGRRMEKFLGPAKIGLRIGRNQQS